MQIYIAEGTQQTGPFDLDTIKAGLNSGKYQSSQLAWYEGAPGWEPISKLPGMEAVAPPPPPPPAAPPPLSYSPPPSPYSPPPSPYSPAPPPYSPNPSTPSAPYSPTPTGSYSPPPPAFVPTPNYPAYPPAAPPPKKGLWAKVGTVLLGLLAVLGGVLRIARPFTHHSYSSSYSSSSTPSDTPVPTPALSVPDVPKTEYVNYASQFTSGDRQRYYQNFAFSYPSSWEKASGNNTKVATDYVELVRRSRGAVVETLGVGECHADGDMLLTELPTLGPKHCAGLEAMQSKGAVEHEKLFEGMTKFGGYAAYEYRSRTVNKNAQGRPYTLFYRCVIVAGAFGKNGVIFEMFASNSSPDVHGIDDLGVRGEMAMIPATFGFRL